MSKNIAIIGTGFLGRCLADKIRPFCGKLLTTYHTNKFFNDSIQYDFFSDDIKNILENRNIDIIILPAKIEFVEDKEALQGSMERFISGTSGKRIIYISSDGIFNGQKGMYKETDIPNPVTNYGRNLELCEKLVSQISNHLIIRPSYIYGYSLGRLDSRLWKTKNALEKGEPKEFFTDMYKSPMEVNQTTEAIINLSFSDYSGIVHVAGKRTSVYDFMRENMEVLGVYTKNLRGVPMPRERPANFLSDTSLDNSLMKKLTDIDTLKGLACPGKE